MKMKAIDNKLKAAQLLAIENGFEIAKYRLEWHDMSVYIADFEKQGDVICTGLPLFILVKNDNTARLADVSETDQLMDLAL